MAKRDKREQAIRQSPKQVRFTDLDRMLQDNGFRRDQGDGSHVVYRHPALGQRITISPHDAFVKSYQVKQSLAALDAVRATEEQQ